MNKSVTEAKIAQEIQEMEIEITELLTLEKQLDKELEEFEKAGVKEDDTVAIMKALHDYNEIRDAVQTIFEYLSNLTSKTLTELHEKYNIPLTEY